MIVNIYKFISAQCRSVIILESLQTKKITIWNLKFHVDTESFMLASTH